jgi:hypothetical protein
MVPEMAPDTKEVVMGDMGGRGEEWEDRRDLRSSKPAQYMPTQTIGSKILLIDKRCEGVRDGEEYDVPEKGTSRHSVGPSPRQSIVKPLVCTSLPISFAVEAYVGEPLSATSAS